MDKKTQSQILTKAKQRTTLASASLVCFQEIQQGQGTTLSHLVIALGFGLSEARAIDSLPTPSACSCICNARITSKRLRKPSMHVVQRLMELVR